MTTQLSLPFCPFDSLEPTVVLVAPQPDVFSPPTCAVKPQFDATSYLFVGDGSDCDGPIPF